MNTCTCTYMHAHSCIYNYWPRKWDPFLPSPGPTLWLKLLMASLLFNSQKSQWPPHAEAETHFAWFIFVCAYPNIFILQKQEHGQRSFPATGTYSLPTVIRYRYHLDRSYLMKNGVGQSWSKPLLDYFLMSECKQKKLIRWARRAQEHAGSLSMIQCGEILSTRFRQMDLTKSLYKSK